MCVVISGEFTATLEESHDKHLRFIFDLNTQRT